jgi:hypothetical protein
MAAALIAGLGGHKPAGKESSVSLKLDSMPHADAVIFSGEIEKCPFYRYVLVSLRVWMHINTPRVRRIENNLYL